jgi:hypothetical protein
VTESVKKSLITACVLAAFVRSEYAKWGKIIRTAKTKKE